MNVQGARELLRRYAFPIFVVFLFCILFAIAVLTLVRHSKTFSDELIADDIGKLEEIFQKIDDRCQILSFDHQQNYIDFLTVEKFVSSEVGSMNLVYPDKWQGPYVPDNPTVQGEVYRIIVTRKGHYIVPGKNIQLSNGIVLDRDLIFDDAADIDSMMENSNKLMYRKKPLAAKIKVSSHAESKKLDIHIVPDTQ